MQARYLISVVFLLLLSTQVTAKAPHSLQSLQSLSKSSDLKDNFQEELDGIFSSGIKGSASRDSAFSLGAQNAYIERMEKLKKAIKNKERELDTLFDFPSLMRNTKGNETSLYFVPPVIQESRDSLSVSGDSKRIRAAGITYQIVRPGRLSSRAPNWREYLLFDSPTTVQNIHKGLLPETSEEKRLWKRWVALGWAAGISQAEEEMAYRTRSLGADFIGMVKYLNLEQKGLIKSPVISSLYRKVRADDSSMTLNERVYQIANGAKFSVDDSAWKPLISDPRGGYRE